MNEYYSSFLKQKLKNDIEHSICLLNPSQQSIIMDELNEIFKSEIVFHEKERNTHGTHQVRDRNAYKNKKERCIARVWNEGNGGQCSCIGKKEYNNFCKTHFNKGGNEWWLGTIDKPRPERPVNSKGKLHYWKDKISEHS